MLPLEVHYTLEDKFLKCSDVIPLYIIEQKVCVCVHVCVYACL